MIRFYIKLWILIAFVGGAVIDCNSQTKSVTHNDAQWIQYYSQVKLDSNLYLFSDISFRRRDFFSEWSQMLIRTGINYEIFKSGIKGTTGFGCFFSFSSNEFSVIEYRPYQDIILRNQKIRNAIILQRLRWEGRFYNTINTDEFRFNNRFRYRVILSFPIVKAKSPNSNFKVNLNVGDEIFINIGKEIVNNYFDNNRIIIGPSAQVKDNLVIGFNYVYQYGQRAPIATFEHTDIFWFTIQHSIAIIKQKREK